MSSSASRQISTTIQTESRVQGSLRNLVARLLPERLILSQMDRTLRGS